MKDSDDSDDDDDDDTSEEIDDMDGQGDVDPEFRRKIADALGGVGFNEDGAESDSSEVVMNDDQMMRLDDKLADIFRSQSTANKGKIGQLVAFPVNASS